MLVETSTLTPLSIPISHRSRKTWLNDGRTSEHRERDVGTAHACDGDFSQESNRVRYLPTLRWPPSSNTYPVWAHDRTTQPGRREQDDQVDSHPPPGTVDSGMSGSSQIVHLAVIALLRTVRRVILPIRETDLLGAIGDSEPFFPGPQW